MSCEPPTPKRRHNDMHMTASNFKEQKNTTKMLKVF